MTAEVVLVGIEASHSMTLKPKERTLFEEALLFSKEIASTQILFGFNHDWFLFEKPIERTKLTGSGLIGAACRGGLEIATSVGMKRFIVFSDGIGEPEMPRAEAEALAKQEIKLDIIYMGREEVELRHLDSLAGITGGKAITFWKDECKEPEEKDEAEKEDEEDVVLDENLDGEVETIIKIQPKKEECEPEQDNSVKGMINRLKEKVW